MDNKIRWNRLDQKSTSALVVIIIGVLVYLGMSNFAGVREALVNFLGIFSPFAIGFIIAYLLNTPMEFMERVVYQKVTSSKWRRGLSVLTTYLLAVSVIFVLVMLVLPSLVESVMTLVSGVESGITRVDSFIQEFLIHGDVPGAQWINSLVDIVLEGYHDVVLMVTESVSDLVPAVVDVGIAIGSGFIAVITAVISSVYMLLEKNRFKRQLKRGAYAILPEEKAHSLLETCRYSNKIFSSFIVGKLIDSGIIGIICFICCLILGLPFAVLLSVIVGITNIIPFFGPFIGAVPCLMILLVMDPWGAVKFGILILVLQQFDGNILGPKILGDSTGLSPLMVLVAIIVGGDLFGFAGMLLGVPTFAVITALVSDWVKKRLAEKGIQDVIGMPLEDTEQEQPQPEPTQEEVG